MKAIQRKPVSTGTVKNVEMPMVPSGSLSWTQPTSASPW